jgi:hypothetical protein
VFRPIGAAKTAGVQREEAETPEMPACNLERWMKNFNGRPFFSLFFIARANQKIPNLALGRQSRVSLDFYPNWPTLTSIYSPNSYRILLLFDSKKKLVSFSLIYINCLREILQDCGMGVQQSLPLPCRCGEHVRRGLAQWLR